MASQKFSDERNQTAKYLKKWREEYDIKQVSDFFGHGTTKTINILRKSNRYLTSRMRKSKTYKYLKRKGHPTRNKIAKYLREWKSGMIAKNIAQKYKTDKKTVLHYLGLSETYCRSIRHLSQKDQMLIKRSPLRKKLAKYLREWKKSSNAKEVAKILGIGRGECQLILSHSKIYKRYYKSREGLTSQQIRFILRFAKKQKIVRGMGGKCVKCNSDNIFTLEFHHSGKEKDNIVSRLLESDFISAEKEAKKCVLLCANCHMLEHSQVELYEKLKDVIRYRTIRL